MDNEKLKWKKTDRLGLSHLMEQLADESKKLVKIELNQISNQLEGLKRMGLTKHTEQITNLKKKISDLKI